MAPSSTATPHTPGHRRSATAILRSMVPHRSHKKTASQTQPPPPPPSNPLNTYEPNRPSLPQLPPLAPSSAIVLPPLEPPVPPFAQGADSPRRMHKKSLSSMSIGSLASKASKRNSFTAPPSPSRTNRGSMDIDLSSIFDIVRHTTRGSSSTNANSNGESSSPQKSSFGRGEKKPGKSKSSLDFGILRQKPKDKKNPSPDSSLAEGNVKSILKDKENQRPKTGGFGLTPSSSAGSGFIIEPGTIPTYKSHGSHGSHGSNGFSALYVLPQNHPHSQQRSSQQGRPRPKSAFVPGVTPQGSNSSLYQPRTSTSSNSSSSFRSKQQGSPAKAAEELMKKYTPTEYDPAKQRQFLAEPTLVPKATTGTGSTGSSGSSGNKQRPKSAFLPSSASVHSGGFSVASPRRTSHELRKSTDKGSSEDSKNASPTGSQGSETSGMSGISANSNRSAGLDLEGIDVAFEALLDARGVPSHLRDRMRSLDIRVKQEFIRKEAQMDEKDKRKSATPSATSGGGLFSRRPQTSHGGKSELRPKSKEGEALKAKALEPAFSPKKSRPRSKTFGASKEKEVSNVLGGGPNSPKKTKEISSGERSLKVKSIVFPPSTTSAIPANGPHSPTMVPTLAPEAWVAWLRVSGRPKFLGNKVFSEGEGSTAGNGEAGMKDVEVAALHKLRLVLRNERLKWVEGFIRMGGMESVWHVVERVLGVEWREEHEDLLLHELLLCLKALCTASLGLDQLLDMETTIFPALIELLFDKEKKGPSEFTTRGLIISLLFTHLSAASEKERPQRTKRILGYLADKVPNEDKRPIEFIEVAHTSRPYRRWCTEVVNVTKEVFWIFLHGANVIALPQYHTYTAEPFSKTHFPSERPPVPAAPYVGGVEWEATNYLSNHLDLLNGCIASLETREERNRLRLDLKNSGWEKLMGGSLRTCKEKLHGAVHDGLKTWVGAAAADVWEIADVRFGPRIEGPLVIEKRRKKKKKQDEDKVELPKIDLGSGVGMNVNVGVGVNGTSGGDGWLY
ncbi:hypothetical protein RUND412_002622 [Rhizina undulata]